jgi:hypothetical protein
MLGRQTRIRGTIAGLLFLALLPPLFVQAQDVKPEDIKAWAMKTKEYKQWLESMKGGTFQFWTRMDDSRRPHKVYVGEGFEKADFKDQEQFVEIFSHYLAGHPDKYMLIDLYDARTGSPIGEYGFGGFKLFPAESATVQAPSPIKAAGPAR